MNSNGFTNNEAAREELVAYLDGELPDHEAQIVEARLGRDEAYRAELTQLDEAWHCLDELPHATVDESFTQSTVEMVALAASDDLAQQRAEVPKQHRTRYLLLAATLLVSIGAGYLLMAAVWPDANRRLIAELPLLENLDLYLQVDSIEYVRLLDQQRTDNMDHRSDERRVSVAMLSEQSSGERRKRLEEMPGEAKARLADQMARFESLSAAQQERVRRLHEAISKDPNADQLVDTLAQYHDVVMRLTPGQRADLMALEPEQRIDRLKRYYAQYQWRETTDLSAEDIASLRSWIQQYARDHRDEILAGIPETIRDRIRKVDEPRQTMMLVMFAWNKSRQYGPQRAARLTPEELRSMIAGLSEEAQARLKAAGSRERQTMVIRQWVERAMQSHPVTNEQLETFFARQLSSDRRADLLSLPRDEMERQLRQEYFDHTYPDGFGQPGLFPRGRGPARGMRRSSSRGEPSKFRPGGSGRLHDRRAPPGDKRPPPGPRRDTP